MDPKVLDKISYGMYIVSSKKGDKINAQIANTVFQVTAEPPVAAVSISKQNYTHEFIAESGMFGVSVLNQDAPMAYIGNFGFKSGRDIDKFKGINYKKSGDGLPLVIDYAAAYFAVKVINRADCGTHTVFIGEVIEGEIINEGELLTYKYYHDVRKGLSSKNAPTFRNEAKAAEAEGDKNMKKYKCTVCGYVYDPQTGDPDNGVEAGTPFEKLPETWVCPVCGAAKDQFEPE